MYVINTFHRQLEIFNMKRHKWYYGTKAIALLAKITQWELLLQLVCNIETGP